MSASAALLAMAAAPAGAALWDAGLLQGGWRSDLPRPLYGSAVDPLEFDQHCLFPGVDFALCPSAPGPSGPPSRVYALDNWRDESVDPLGRFWVVGANVEPAGDAACNSGPPNQSEAVAAPFEGVFGLRFGPPEDGRAPWRNEWQLAIDLAHRPAQLAHRPDCRAGDFIPYLGVGLASERGSGGQPFAHFRLDGPGPLLRMGVRLVESNAAVFAEGEPVPQASRGQHGGVWLESSWGGVRRWIWLTLFSSFERGREIYSAPWNWALRESVHAPGADIVVAALPALREACPEIDWRLPVPAPAAWQGGVRHALELDVAALYHCLGSHFQLPPPLDEALPLTGIHAWVEVGLREHDGLPGLSADDYDSRLSLAFDGIDLLPPGPHPLVDDRRFLIAFSARLMSISEAAAAARVDDLPGTLERSAAISRLLRDDSAVAHALMPVALQRLVLGGVDSPGLLELNRRQLAERQTDAAGVARLLLRSPAVVAAAREAGGEVPLLQRRFLEAAGADREQAIARYPHLLHEGKWRSHAVHGGSEQLAATLAEALLSLPEGRSVAEIVLLYHAFLGVIPDGQGIAHWARQPDMPARLAELLYFAPEARERWTPVD